MNIFVQEAGKEEAVRITSVKDRDLTVYFWKGNDRILYLKDTGGDENFHLYGASIDGKTEKAYTDFPKVRVDLIDDLENNPSEIIISMNKRNPQVFDPFRLNIETGEMKMIAENPGNISGWITDHDGKLRVATATDGVNASILYREKETDKFKVVLTTNFKESVSPYVFMADNKNMIAVSNLGRDKAAVVEFDIANGKEVKVLYENKDYDVSGIGFSKKDKKLLYANFVSWKDEKYFFDKDAEAMYKKLDEKLPGHVVYAASWTKDEQKYMIRSYNDRSKGAYYIYDKKSGKLDSIHTVAPWIVENDMAEMKPITYKTRDGLTINGYLTLPVGRDPKNLPVVVNPHGGPWARDEWGFNPEIQFLANRGYAVFQMNFRGSTGYGKKFFEASFKQWGLKMQNDISDGVQWLIDQGYADPKRVAIYGGSYGGYATLAGITMTPDLYACAIDYVGVSNLFTFMSTIPPYWKPMLDMFYEMVGDPKKDSVQMHNTSPVFFADKIKCPLFIAQGANDPRVNKAEADQMVAALKKRGVAVEYMVKDNEGHGFRNEENKFEFYAAMEKFLAKYLVAKEEQAKK
ncbi:MAG: S9 family peptidase [Bacteroidota bacterium]